MKTVQSCRSREFVRSSAGFTLVEMLIVIAIVGVLAGLLLPAIHNVCEAGKQAVCTSNLRQLGLALAIYANTHNGAYPTAESAHGETGPTNWWENPRFLASLGLKHSCEGASVLVCPADPRPEVCEDGGARPFRSSYAANTSCFGMRRGGSKRGRFKCMIAEPAQTMAFCDAAYAYPGPLVVGWQGCVNQNFAYRHKGVAQAVFLDGHVESIAPDDVPGGEDAWQRPFWGSVPQYWGP